MPKATARSASSAWSAAHSMTRSWAAPAPKPWRGNDIIYGGGGADTLPGGAGNDTISYHDGMHVDGGEGYDTLLADESTDGSGIHFKVLGSNFEAIGGRYGNDVIDARGLSYGVTVGGYGGNDTFYGGNGE